MSRKRERRCIATDYRVTVIGSAHNLKSRIALGAKSVLGTARDLGNDRNAVLVAFVNQDNLVTGHVKLVTVNIRELSILFSSPHPRRLMTS